MIGLEDQFDPNNFINTFPVFQKDTLLASNPEEFSLYFKEPQLKAFCKVISVGNSVSGQNGINEFEIINGNRSGLKPNQVISIIDEESGDYHILTIYGVYPTKIETFESIDIQTNRVFLMEVYIQTRELYTKNPGVLNEYDRGIFRYPYLPNNWSNINPYGVVTFADRSDVKTFSSNVSINWQIVIQDTVIEESFQQMDYEFHSHLYSIYRKQELIGYRPRDLNLNLYLVEMLPIEIGKMNRYWIEEVKIKYKIHNELNNFGYISKLSNIR